MMDSKNYSVEWEIEQINEAIDYFSEFRTEEGDQKVQELIELRTTLSRCLMFETVDPIQNWLTKEARNG